MRKAAAVAAPLSRRCLQSYFSLTQLYHAPRVHRVRWQIVRRTCPAIRQRRSGWVTAYQAGKSFLWRSQSRQRRRRPVSCTGTRAVISDLQHVNVCLQGFHYRVLTHAVDHFENLQSKTAIKSVLCSIEVVLELGHLVLIFIANKIA